jgi:hypothetical protein
VGKEKEESRKKSSVSSVHSKMRGVEPPQELSEYIREGVKDRGGEGVAIGAPHPPKEQARKEHSEASGVVNGREVCEREQYARE